MENKVKKIKSVCSYCGTGCGVEIAVSEGKIVGVEGDTSHSANYGMLCSKGRNLHHTVDTKDRLLEPLIRNDLNEEFKISSMNEALSVGAKKFADIIKEHGPDSVAFYVSGQLLTEDYYVFNKLMKGFVGSNNIDTNSRLCMSSAVAGYKRAFGVDGPPCCYDDIDEADNIFIFGANPAYAHPIIFRRIEKAKEKRPHLKVVVIDPRRTDSTSIADLHLKVRPGTDVVLLQAMLNVLMWEGLVDEDFIKKHTNGSEEVFERAKVMTPKKASKICGVKPSYIVRAAHWFANGNSLSFWTMGFNQSTSGTDKNNALINLHLATGQIGKAGAGPFSLTGQPNAMGGREVGGLSNLLPAHRNLDNQKDREDVAKLWGVEKVRKEPGLTATEIFDGLNSGKVKAVWIACTNPVVSMPNAGIVEEGLKKAELVMVSDAYHPTDTTNFAHILLPAAGWGEKDGTVTNSERSISYLNKAIEPIGNAMADWKIATEFALKLGYELGKDWSENFNYKNTEDIFNEHRETTRGTDCDITGLSYGLLKSEGPKQWPVTEDNIEGTKRLYTNNIFQTKDGKANFVDVEFKDVAEPTDKDYPFSLTTGRIRDQWHTRTKTSQVPSLNQHVTHPRISMSPKDAEELGIKEKELVRVISRRGEVVVPLRITEDILDGLAFMPMHWGNLSSTGGRINTVVNNFVDPISKEPEFKHSAVSVKRYNPLWRGTFLLKGDEEKLGQDLIKDFQYGVVNVQGMDNIITRIDVASKEPLSFEMVKGFDDFLFSSIQCESITYMDKSSGIYKRAWTDSESLNAVRFIGPYIDDVEWTKSLMLEGQLISDDIRPFLLAPGGGLVKEDAKGEIICACNNVGEKEILKAIDEGVETVDGIKKCLNAGTGCGSCVPEIKRLIKC